jgi:hypothetical protein
VGSSDLRGTIIFGPEFTPGSSYTPGPDCNKAGSLCVISPNWTTILNYVDLVGSGTPGFYGNTICTSTSVPGTPGSTGAGGTDPCIDLAGSTLPAGAVLISKAFTFTAGVTYDFVFDIAGSQRGDSTSVKAGFYDSSDNILKSQTFNLSSSAPFVQEDISFTPTTTVVGGFLFFDDTSANGAVNTAATCAGNLSCGFMGALVENVTLSTNSPFDVTPEPGTFAIFGLGLAGTLAYIARRKAAR